MGKDVDIYVTLSVAQDINATIVNTIAGADGTNGTSGTSGVGSSGTDGTSGTSGSSGTSGITIDELKDHNQLDNLQGGDSTSSEFYHLPKSEHDALTDAHAQLENLQTDKTPTFAGLILGDAGKVVWDTAPSSDVTASGNLITGTKGETLAFGEMCYFKSDGKFWKSDADASTTMPVIAMALDDSGNFLTSGFVRNDAWSWTVGGLLYADTTTAGGMTQTAPSDESDVIQIVGIALSATTIFFNPNIITTEVGLDVVDEGTTTPVSIAWTNLTAIPKTYFADHSSDQTFNVATPSASDVGKRFSITKSGTGAGKIIVDVDSGVHIVASGVTTSSGGTVSLAGGAYGSMQFLVLSATVIKLEFADGDVTFA